MSRRPRVMEQADPDELLTSPAVPLLVAGSGIEFDDRGEHERKGVPPGVGASLPLTLDTPGEKCRYVRVWAYQTNHLDSLTNRVEAMETP